MIAICHEQGCRACLSHLESRLPAGEAAPSARGAGVQATQMDDWGVAVFVL